MNAEDTPTVLIFRVATSGLSEEKHTILEICCILVEIATLDVLETFSGVVRHTPAAVAGCYEGHAALVQECLTSEDATSMKAKEGFLLAGPWSTAKAVCGRDLDFHLKFLRKHMPTFARSLPRLQVELRTQELLWRARGVPEFVPSMNRTMRASDEAILNYEQLVHWTTGGKGLS
jgi:oligoribonuclease (3'-5' exoribonuclease)